MLTASVRPMIRRTKLTPLAFVNNVATGAFELQLGSGAAEERAAVPKPARTFQLLPRSWRRTPANRQYHNLQLCVK
jgi:hypothetical protein